MGNNNTNTKENNPAVPNNNNPNAANPTTVIKVDGKDIPKESVPQVNPQDKPVVPTPGAEIKGNINVQDFIKNTTTETKTLDSEQEARIAKAKLLTDAINSRFYFENVQYVNSETGDRIGSKIRYTKDPNGKTIYDYMNDPEVTAHVGFKLMDEEDQQDGSIVNKQISIYWVNPVY